MKKIFLSGMFRSGTTTIARLLNTHPDIALTSDSFFPILKFLRNKIYKSKFPYFNEVEPFSDKFLEHLELNTIISDKLLNTSITKNEYNEIRNDICYKYNNNKPTHSQKILQYVEKSNFKGNSIDVLNELLKLNSELYSDKKLKYLGFKTVWQEEFITPLLKSNYFVFHSIRDPRAVIASKLNNKEYGSNPILFLIRQWRKSVAYSIINMKFKKYSLIKFEELISNPRLQVKRMYSAIGANNIKNFKNFSQIKEENGENWIQNSSFKSEKKFNKNSLNHWKRNISEDEIRIIELLCEPEMKFLKYNFLFKDNDFKSLVNYKENKSKFANWIKGFNYDIDKKNIQQEITRLQILNLNSSLISKKIKKSFFISETVFEKLKNKNE